MTQAEYAALPGIRSSALKAYATSSRRGEWAATTPRKPNAGMNLGTAFHIVALNEVAIRTGFAIGGPINEKTGQPYGTTTKAYAEWAAAQDKPCIDEDMAAKLEDMQSAVDSNPIAAGCIAEHWSREVYIDWEIDGVKCKALCDALRMGPDNKFRSLMDLKTTSRRLSPRQCLREILDYGYDIQLAWYIDGLIANGHPIDNVNIVFVSSAEECDSMVVTLSDALLARGRKLYKKALANMHGDGSGEWSEEIEIDAPAWESEIDADGIETEEI